MSETTTSAPENKPAPQAQPVPAPAPTQWRPPTRSKATIIAIAVVGVLGVLAILYAWRLPPFAGVREKTDNAYVRGRVTVISPQVNGYVTQVNAQDFAEVEAGQVLATIDDRIYEARVAQARANVAAQEAAFQNSTQARVSRETATFSQDAAIATARAQLERAQADMRRADALVADGSISARERDQAVSTLRASEAALRQAEASRAIGTQDVRTVEVGRSGLEAAVAAAKAQLRLAEIDLDNTVIRAPVAGRLSEVSVRNGAYVTPGTQLLYLVPHDIWVIANFKEAQTRNMRVGQPVTFRADALGRFKFKGHVQNLSPAAGSEFAVLKADNATGNFVKVAQRIAVRISIDPGQELAKRLSPGMSVEVAVNTREADNE